MIQRIQSIYLLVASILSLVLIYVFELWTVNETKVFAKDLLFSELLLEISIPVLFYLSGLIALFTIFLFKNRKLQFVLGRVIILINLILLGILIYQSVNLPGEDVSSEKGIGMFIPTVVILLIVLANKAIKKDEDLVKSVDRLR